MTVQAGPVDGERGAVGQPLHPYRAVAVDDHWAAVRSIPTAIALATPMTDFRGNTDET
jgi:hypothetical protein